MTKEKYTFPCADNNETHQYAMARYYVTCKNCRIYREPSYLSNGERVAAPRRLTQGMTMKRYNAWLNKLIANMMEEYYPRYD